MMCRESHRRRERRAAERLLEDERLTDELVDEAARLLLDWGTTQLDANARPGEGLSRAELGACVSRLRRIMRRVNEVAGQASVERQAERVRVLLSRIESGTDADVDEGAE
jgi:hypothetical protein